MAALAVETHSFSLSEMFAAVTPALWGQAGPVLLLLAAALFVVAATWTQVTTPELTGQATDCFLVPTGASMFGSFPGAQPQSQASDLPAGWGTILPRSPARVDHCKAFTPATKCPTLLRPQIPRGWKASCA
jgi:hypothetical protein